MNQMYGYLNGAYYTVDGSSTIVIPDTNDITSSFVRSIYHPETKEAEVDMYTYHSDIISEANKDRVNDMKEFLIDTKITDIDHLNNDFVIGVGYELYNNAGKMIKSGETTVAAKYVNAMINMPVDEEDRLKYRKAYVIDGKISLQVPQISHYGIKNYCVQNPFTLKLTKLFVLATTGAIPYTMETNSQMEYQPAIQPGNSASYSHHCDCNPCCGVANIHDNFNSNFITNKIGTTMIDQLVVPAILEAPADIEQIEISEFILSGSQYTIKIAEAATSFSINVEVVIDNFNVVYDKEVIDQILDNNKDEDDDSSGCDCDNCPCNPNNQPTTDDPTTDDTSSDEPSVDPVVVDGE